MNRRPARDRVLIIDQRTSYPLQLCHALRRQGHEIHGLAEAGAALLQSRRCAVKFPTRPWYADPVFFPRLHQVVERGGYDVIYVCSEVLLEQLLSLVKTEAAWRAFPFAAADPTGLFDKNAVVEQVAAAGVPVPRNVVPESEADVDGIVEQLGLPIVVKGEKGAAAQNVRIVRHRADVRRRYREICDSERGYAGRPALQEYIDGPTYLVGGVFRNGEALRIAAYRKVLMYPAAGGATVKGVSERPPRLIESALAAFRVLGFTGLGSLDFLYDPRDGEFKLIEINPRPWATIGLALECTDLLSAYHALAKGEPVAPDLAFLEAVRWHRLSGEVRLIAEQPSRLPGFVLDCLDPRVRSDFDWHDVAAALRAAPRRWCRRAPAPEDFSPPMMAA